MKNKTNEIFIRDVRSGFAYYVKPRHIKSVVESPAKGYSLVIFKDMDVVLVKGTPTQFIVSVAQQLMENMKHD